MLSLVVSLFFCSIDPDDLILTVSTLFNSLRECSGVVDSIVAPAADVTIQPFKNGGKVKSYSCQKKKASASSVLPASTETQAAPTQAQPTPTEQAAYDAYAYYS